MTVTFHPKKSVRDNFFIRRQETLGEQFLGFIDVSQFLREIVTPLSSFAQRD